MQKKEVVTEWLDSDKTHETTKSAGFSNTGRVFLSFTRNVEQEKALTENGFGGSVTYNAPVAEEKQGERRSGLHPGR